MCIRDSNDSLYYTSADALHIYCTNIKNTTHNTSSYFKDTEFIVNKLNLDANILVNNERDKVIDYLLSNSIITNLFYANNYLIIQSEVGKSKIIDKRIDLSLIHIFLFGLARYRMLKLLQR